MPNLSDQRGRSVKRLLAAATLTILLSPPFPLLASCDPKWDQDVKDKRDWKKDHKYKDDDDKDRAEWGRTKDRDKDYKYEDDKDRDKGGDYDAWSGKLQTA